MARTEFELEELNSILASEFERYAMEHPDRAEVIPKDALVVLLLEGDDEFNGWSHERAEQHAEPSQPVIEVRIKKLEPPRSRISELELAPVA